MLLFPGPPLVGCRFLKLCTLNVLLIINVSFVLCRCVNWWWQSWSHIMDLWESSGESWRVWYSGSHIQADTRYKLFVRHTVCFSFGFTFRPGWKQEIVLASFPGSPALGYKHCNHESKAGRVWHLFSSERDRTKMQHFSCCSMSYTFSICYM